MAGHPSLLQQDERTGVLLYGGKKYNIKLSFHRVEGGIGWGMSRYEPKALPQMQLFLKELGKTFRESGLC